MYPGEQLVKNGSPHHRRHPPQLCRQMEQEETLPGHTADDLVANQQWQPRDMNKLSNNTLSVAPTTTAAFPDVADPPSADSQSYRPPSPRPHLPPTQGSQGSSSTGSGATGMSIGTTSGGGSVSSGKSARGYFKAGGAGARGANRCSSSASSSTEETEARERRFGSVDLHPLPMVTLNPTGARRSLVVPSAGHNQQLHLAALLTLQQHFSAYSAALTDVSRAAAERSDSSQPEVHSSSQPLVPTSNSSLLCLVNSTVDTTTQSAATLYPSTETGQSHSDSQAAALANQNQFHPLNVLPPVFWPCLVCPVHASLLLHSSGVMLQELDKAKDRHGSPGLGTSGTTQLAQLPTGFPGAGFSGYDVVPSLWMGSTPFGGPTNSTPRIGPYELGPTLGRGNFAVVKLAKHIPTKVKVAIKIMNKELIGSVNLNKVSRELEAMKRCQHPHIVRLYHVMESESNIFMVTEYASRGEVFDHISKSRAFNEKEARELFWQIVCAIDFCHNSGVVHRDLKAENLLLDSELKIKVADFGFCNFFHPNELLSTHCGSPQYAAPELFKGEPYDGPLADVWSLGVILYILVCGSFPFPGESLGDIRSQVLRGLVRFPFFLSTACEQVIRCMLQVDPTRRFKLKQIINMPWMQASPNVAHYQAMMTKYEEKAKERHFDEIFRRQYPEHSELVKVERVGREERRLDLGILRALAIGAGFDESQVRTSTLQNKCDRFHAAYQLLAEKTHRFRRNPHLFQAVNDAVWPTKTRRRSGGVFGWRSSLTSVAAPGLPCSAELSDGTSEGETGGIRYNVQLATVPDVLDETMAEADNETNEFGTSTSTATSIGEKSHSPTPAPGKEWYSQSQPGCMELNVALFILKADEDAILFQLGLVNPLITAASLSTMVRRHTVQLTGSPLTNQTQIPDVVAEPNQVNTAMHGSKDPTVKKVAADGSGTSQRLPAHPFPRQTTQPHIGGLQRYKNESEHQEALIRTALNWMPDPWHLGGNESCPKGDSDLNQFDGRTRASGKRPLHLPSLELGQEASTTRPPDRHLRPGLQRDSSLRDSDEEQVETEALMKQGSGCIVEQTVQDVNTRKQSLLLEKGHPTLDLSMTQDSCVLGPALHLAQEPLSNIPPWDCNVRDGACFDRLLTSKLGDPTGDTSLDPAAMETDNVGNPNKSPTEELAPGGRGYWSTSHVDPGEVDEESAVLGALLPQLNLPANIPAMIHQPVARFTVKDPHLLAPPEFMTPQCSSFPRRSSDGAAELQPLQRPGLTVGGSYPEQTNYRNIHTGSQTDTTTLKSSPPNESACSHAPSGQSEALDLTQKPLTGEQPDDKQGTDGLTPSERPNDHRLHHHRPIPLVSTKLRTSPAVLAAQQRSLFSTLRSSPASASRAAGTYRWKPPGTKKPLEPTENSGDPRQKNVIFEGQFARYQKRFSLPIGYTPTDGTSVLGDSSQATGCTCHHPLTPELVQQIQQLFTHSPASIAAWPQATAWTLNSSTSCFRRGSEASQLVAWKRRLHQCGYLRDPSVDESVPFETTIVEPHQTPSSDSNTPFMAEGSANTAYMQPPPGSPMGGLPSSAAAPPEPFTHHEHHTLLSADWAELDSSGQLQAQLPRTSPPGIHLSELKTELHKLESESKTNLCSPDQTADTLVAPVDVSTAQHSTRFLRRIRRSREGTTCPITYTPIEPLSNQGGWSHRSPSNHSSRRASSVASTPIGTCSFLGAEDEKLDVTHRRYRYSVGDSLDHTLKDHGELPLIVPDPNDPARVAPPLSCHPSIFGLHSQAVTHHLSIAPTLSNPDHPSPCNQLHASYFLGTQLPVVSDLDRTAWSSPGPSSVMAPTDFSMLLDASDPANTTIPPNTPQQAAEPVEPMMAPASTGMKRRLLGSLHQTKQSHDYLRTLQHPGGSLDRRWNFDFLTSPKRKIYQEWLPKVTAFSRKAAVTMLQAVHALDSGSQEPGANVAEGFEPSVIVSSPGLFDLSSVSPTSPCISAAPQCPSAPMSATSSVAASLANMDQESDEHFDEDPEDVEDERECYLAPLQSQLPLPTRSRATVPTNHMGLLDPTSSYFPLFVHDPLQQSPTPVTGSHLLTTPSFPLTETSEFQSHALMFLRPGEDDDDLAEIDRVNRRLAMGGGFPEFGEPSAYMGCPTMRNFVPRPPAPQMFPPAAPSSFQPVEPQHASTDASPTSPPGHS